MIASRLILLEMTNVSNHRCKEKQNTHFMFYNSFFFFRKSIRLWDSVQKHGNAAQATDDNTPRRMTFARWISTAKNAHSEYVILFAFQLQQWLGERASLLYVQCLYCYLSFVHLKILGTFPFVLLTDFPVCLRGRGSNLTNLLTSDSSIKTLCGILKTARSQELRNKCHVIYRRLSLHCICYYTKIEIVIKGLANMRARTHTLFHTVKSRRQCAGSHDR